MATILLVERIPFSLLNSTNPAIIDMCKNLINDGHKVIALTMDLPNDQGTFVETLKIPIDFQRQEHNLKILTSIAFSILAPIYAASLVRRRKIDVICYNDVVPIFWPISWLFLIGVKKINITGDFLAGYLSKKGLGRFVYMPLLNVERWHWRQYSIVTVTSIAFRRLLLANGIPRTRIKILPESVDDHLFKVKQKSKSIDYSSTFFPIITHGLLTYYKGVDTLLYAARKILDKGYRLHVTILGDGPERPALEKLAKELHIENVVSIPGWIPLADIPNYISSARLGVVMRRKGLANDLVLTQALLQYACVDTPFLAPDTETILEEIEDKANGIIYHASDVEDLADKIIFAIENPELLQKIADNAYQWVIKHHSRNIVANQAEEICLSLTN